MDLRVLDENFDDDDNDVAVDTAALLTEATRLNVNWTGEHRFGDSDIAADPALDHYTRLQPGHRGGGLGGRLLDAAIGAARERGVRRISLSVEKGNPAVRLYRGRGFVDVPGAAAGTMVLAVR